jgi:hypothetical protein
MRLSPNDEELDVECRVLFNEFIKAALETAARIDEHKEILSCLIERRVQR